MRKIRTRLALHFTYQLLMQWVLILLTMMIILFSLFNYMANQDLKRTFSTGALDAIKIETIIQNDEVEMNHRWKKLLKEQGYWLQIINDRGSVIYSLNAPADLKKTYGATELLNIQESRRLGSYRVSAALEPEADGLKSVVYLMGRQDLGTKLLNEWFQKYNQKGQIRADAMAELEQQLHGKDEYLQVVNTEGEILQSIGQSAQGSTDKRYLPLDLVAIHAEPGSYPMELSVHYDEDSGNTWLLHQGKQGRTIEKQSIFYDLIKGLVVIGVSVMVVTLALSIWHGYRYGQPLTLFAGWFERMGEGRYSEALTEKERKKVFKRNGKIRMRYRLYKEVIAGFYEMATQLDASQRDRKLLEQTREEWMTGISHDLRTPLATIQGYGHLLESGQFSWDEAELKEMGKVIREKGDFMLELVQDFSLTFQLKNNALRIPLEPIELNEFVRRSVLRYVNDATIDTAVFSYEEWEEELTIMANPKWFRRMLDNIITNAVNHNPEGTEITVSTGIAGDAAWICVADNGQGMDEETRCNLFERYYRGTSTDETTDGAGLGMSIAHAIVIAHQGRIRVESEPQQGAKVIMEFPLIAVGNE
ncbi:sensor histidine kinase [Paenibacillus aceti]|uniref:histidine kinase n=1 Tax=Paenibacillus aceti TaxID=1820010 RepID=A0ABQ1W2P9_9BACL|nr:HAMP domain-containing sensor histidine kinase [Paenibacillus aceti]GGG09881.1 two-component sensor histidine kinase [Paenibacillus aceti]